MRFYFDVISPYAYLAWTQLGTRGVEPVPVLFAGLLEAHGTRGPAEIPAKRRYIFRDLMRTARRLGVRFEPPPAHPFNPLLALRVASLPMEAARRRAVIDGLFAAVWAGGPGVTDPDVVARIAGAEAVAEAGTAAAKARLRRQTDEAIARGVFGVPTIEVDGELFWGLDAFANLDAYLRGEGTLDPDEVARWDALPATAARRGS